MMLRTLVPGCAVAAAFSLLASLAGCARPTPAGDPGLDAVAAVTPAVQGWTRTRGGAGGRIIRVTTLAATGPGSFTEAVSATGPRIIVFEVGGVIDLGERVVRIDEPYVTIAGQTAPSPGISLIKGGISITTHDVVLQHVRVRPGEAGKAKRSGWEIDGIATGEGAHDVVIDHVSTTWATDENLSASGPRFGDGTSDDPAVWREATSHRITLSNNLVAEALSESTHAEGEHSKGTLVHDNATDVLLYGNLYASNRDRAPLFKGGARGAVVNNYIFNPGHRAMQYALPAGAWKGREFQDGMMAIVGNVLHHGVDTAPGVPLLTLDAHGDLLLHARDNLALDRSGRPVPMLTRTGTGQAKLLDAPPTWPASLPVRSSAAVVEHVLANVGARPWDRDEVDARIVRQVREGTSRVIDGERDVGGYPVVPETRRPFDSSLWDLETMTPRSPDALR